ncbi:MAG TPA: MFS transporter [Anaerolineales bacterium]|nr:MFS transporter [Anaerolineales bacterium]
MKTMKLSLLFAFVLGFVGFVTSFGAHIVAVNLPEYAKEVGVGVAMIGLLIAAYDFAEIIAKPIFGTISDKQGMKKTLLIGIGVFIAASLLYLVVPPQWLLGIRFLQGVGAAALSAVSLAFVGIYYEQNRGRAYGIYNAIKGAGYVLSPLAGGFIIAQSHFSNIFVAAAGIGVLALVLSLFLPDVKEKVDLDDDDDDFSLQSFVSVFRDPKLIRWYAIIVVNMFFVSILFGFLPVRVYVLQYSPVQTGLILSLVALSYLLIQPAAGYLADKTDVTTTIRVGLILSAISIIAAPFVKDLLLIVDAIIAGIGVGIVCTNTDTLVSKLAEGGKLGATMGAAGSFKEFGDMVGPILIGVLSQFLGLAWGFVICGILGLFSLVLIQAGESSS